MTGSPDLSPLTGKKSHSLPLLPNPEERAARAAVEKIEAERRLQEAEQRLRAAIEELHSKQRRQGDVSSFVFSARHPLCCHAESCVAHAVGCLCQGFLLAYGVRVGIGVLLRAFKLMRHRPLRSVLDLQLLLSENNLIIREEACRNGLLFGGFASLYHATRCLLRRIRDKDDTASSFIAGAVSGISLLSLDDKGRRRGLALYLLARVGQCVCNSSRLVPSTSNTPLRTTLSSSYQQSSTSTTHGLPTPSSSSSSLTHRPHLPLLSRLSSSLSSLLSSARQHGSVASTALFCWSSAQIMYAYVMRPETLPSSYFDFIVNTGPIAAVVLEAVRLNCRGQPINTTAVSSFVRSNTKDLSPLALGLLPSAVPCSVMHPTHPSCSSNSFHIMSQTFRKTVPLYLSLSLVPFVVLNLQKFMQSPLRTLWLATRSAVRSTSFISLFVGAYQAVVCLHRKSGLRDHKLLYWLAGLIAGTAVLIEKPSRRGELALYTLPRAADSLWYILVNRHLLPDVKYAEVVLFCACMAALMYFHEHEPETMAPFVRGIVSRFLNHNMFVSTIDASTPIASPISTSRRSELQIEALRQGTLNAQRSEKGRLSSGSSVESSVSKGSKRDCKEVDGGDVRETEGNIEEGFHGL